MGLNTSRTDDGERLADFNAVATNRTITINAAVSDFIQIELAALRTHFSAGFLPPGSKGYAFIHSYVEIILTIQRQVYKMELARGFP